MYIVDVMKLAKIAQKLEELGDTKSADKYYKIAAEHWDEFDKDRWELGEEKYKEEQRYFLSTHVAEDIKREVEKIAQVIGLEVGEYTEKGGFSESGPVQIKLAAQKILGIVRKYEKHL